MRNLGCALPKKHVVFFCPVRTLDSCRFRKKPVNLGDNKNISKKTSSFREIKNIFPAMFFLAVFFRRHH